MMCAEKQDDQGECSQGMNNIHHQNIQAFQDQFLLHQHQNQLMQHQQTLIFPPDPIQPWSNPPSFNPPRFDQNNDPFHSSPYAGIFGGRRTGGPFGYDGLAGVGPTPFGLQAELGKMTAQEIMDAKALAASKSHSEAERRRRERINNHLAKLRSLLPSTTKTDKASLLAEVIQHVKELKRQTSIIAETSPVPTESDELTVDNASDEEGRFMIKASLCCEDRSDLIPDLIKTLKALRLRTLKAEITTLGGRVKNVLFVTGDHNNNNDELGHENDEDHFDDHDNDNDNSNNYNNQPQYCITSIQEALKAVIEKKIGDQDSSSGGVKRQRTANNNNINIYP